MAKRANWVGSAVGAAVFVCGTLHAAGPDAATCKLYEEEARRERVSPEFKSKLDVFNRVRERARVVAGVLNEYRKGLKTSDLLLAADPSRRDPNRTREMPKEAVAEREAAVWALRKRFADAKCPEGSSRETAEDDSLTVERLYLCTTKMGFLRKKGFTEALDRVDVYIKDVKLTPFGKRPAGQSEEINVTGNGVLFACAGPAYERTCGVVDLFAPDNRPVDAPRVFPMLRVFEKEQGEYKHPRIFNKFDFTSDPAVLAKYLAAGDEAAFVRASMALRGCPPPAASGQVAQPASQSVEERVVPRKREATDAASADEPLDPAPGPDAGRGD